MLIAVLGGFCLALFAPWLQRRLGPRVGWVLALLPLAQLFYLLQFAPRIAAGEAWIESYPWLPELGFSLSFTLDGLSWLMGLLITGIGALVLIYSGGYLAGHPQQGLFFTYLLVFMAAMLGLVLASNLIALYLFWELTTISSYLLIGFEHQQAAARAAAWQALMVTMAGGLALLTGALWLGVVGGSFELADLLARADLVRGDARYLPILGLFALAAFTKSAQFPFHFWLPAAMAAPTPVSAYLHSATMVKAGIYLLARIQPILGGTPEWVLLLTSVGAVTTLLAAVLAFRAHDLKQILAYATVSILGTLTLLLGLGTPGAAVAAMALLVAHALYKGSLFLVAGAIDHGADQRDVRQLGGLRRAMPITAVAAALAGLSMVGIAPFWGYLAKEELYAILIELPQLAGLLTSVIVVANIFLVAAAGLVALRPFVGALKPTLSGAHEVSLSLWLGPVVLSGVALGLGLAPAAIGAQLIGPAASVVRGEVVPVKFALWHGFNLALLLSLVTLALGALLSQTYDRLPAVDRGLARLARVGPAAAYQALLKLLLRSAGGLTRHLQNGLLRSYVRITILAAVALVWLALARGVAAYQLPPPTAIYLYEAALAALIVGATLLTLAARSRLTAIVSLGVIGYGVAIIFMLYGAPDLAMTQFVIETLTVILFVLIFVHLPESAVRHGRAVLVRDLVVSLAAGGTITVLLLFAKGARRFPAISDYYVEQSLPSGHGRNIVNVILVDFRAIDTLGEITVLAVAGLGVYALLKLRPRRGDAP